MSDDFDRYSKQGIMEMFEANMSNKAKAEKREMEALKHDISTANSIVQDAINRYRKAKLKARSKAQAASETVFSDLDKYESREQIHDDYGWEFISEKECYRLMQLWDLREQSRSKSKVYTDRVIEMVEQALRSVIDPYWEIIDDYNRRCEALSKQAEEIARNNLKRKWERDNG